MKIRIINVDEGDLGKVQARVYEIADANGISREDALRQALLLWRDQWREATATVEVTLEEWGRLAPLLEQIRKKEHPPAF